MLKISTEEQIDKISLATIEGVEHSLLWDRAGEVRLIPYALIRNARETLASWSQVKAAGAIEEVPAKYLAIPWDSCLGLPAPASTVRVEELGHQPPLGLLED